MAVEEAVCARWLAGADLLHGQEYRAIDHAVDQETMLAGVDVRGATTLDYVVERRQRDDPECLIQRREVPSKRV